MLWLKDILLLDVFEVNNEIDVLVHIQEVSYSRVNHPDEIFNIGEKHDLKVISQIDYKLDVQSNNFPWPIWAYFELWDGYV